MSIISNLIMKMQMISLMMENGLGETTKPILTTGDPVQNKILNDFLPNQSINLTIADSGLALPVFSEHQKWINVRGVISNYGTINVHSIGFQEHFDEKEELLALVFIARTLTLIKSINIINFLKMPHDTAKKYIGIEDEQTFTNFINILLSATRILPAVNFDSIIKIGACSMEEIISLYRLSIRGNDSCPVFICDNPDLDNYPNPNAFSEEKIKELKRILKNPNIGFYQMGNTEVLKLGNRDCRLF